ncbi:MAG TPA: hypothetical protein VNK43_01790 [Gemmatimonadales bacterium]|nr:hypothetical protein [Gemmatimonadales bacterium]
MTLRRAGRLGLAGAAGGRRVGVVGLDDPVEGTPDLGPAGDGGRDEVTIWLVQAPGVVDAITPEAARPPDLILGGHTHAGQVRVPLLPPVRPVGSGRFVAGWYRDAVAPLYLSRGVGTSGVPFRFGAPPELPVFTLRRR